MNGFDMNLLHNSKIMDTLFKAFGEYAPKKRLLQVDYKENGVDKNISFVAYQYHLMSDKELITGLVDSYAMQDKVIGCIGEVSENGLSVAILYLAEWYMKECLEEGD